MNELVGKCVSCDKELTLNNIFMHDDEPFCRKHWIERENEKLEQGLKRIFEIENDFDMVQKPKHYHSYDMDTLTFLEHGFPPEVLIGFCTGSIIKYLQRYQLKNGAEDLGKAQFYMNMLVDLEKKKNSSE